MEVVSVLQWTTSDWLGPVVALWLPSLGQRGSMWEATIASLPDWSHCTLDLPGHGGVAPASSPFSLAELATELVGTIARHRVPDSTLIVAGCSIGGAIALEVAALGHPDVAAVVTVGAGAKIGNSQAWAERAALVRSSGTTALTEGSRDRWFSPEFCTRHPEVVQHALDNLVDIDRESYARCCEALGGFDLRGEASSLTTPTLVISGEFDEVSTAMEGKELASALPQGSFQLVPGVRHLIPYEAPEVIASSVTDFVNAL